MSYVSVLGHDQISWPVKSNRPAQRVSVKAGSTCLFSCAPNYLP